MFTASKLQRVFIAVEIMSLMGRYIGILHYPPNPYSSD